MTPDLISEKKTLDNFTHTALCNLRFLFPWLSHLCSSVHLDKHMQLPVSSALAEVLSLTVPLYPDIKPAAWHLLHFCTLCS